MSPGKKLSCFTRTEIETLFKSAKTKVTLPGLRILRAPATANQGRVLIVTPRKLGNAPERNLTRRRVRSIYRAEKLYLKPYDCVLLFNKKALSLSFEELTTILCNALS